MSPIVTVSSLFEEALPQQYLLNQDRVFSLILGLRPPRYFASL
jgi:hypothetical protein